MMGEEGAGAYVAGADKLMRLDIIIEDFQYRICFLLDNRNHSLKVFLLESYPSISISQDFESI